LWVVLSATTTESTMADDWAVLLVGMMVVWTVGDWAALSVAKSAVQTAGNLAE
jgi:hypothetical protein